ncbi:MAG: DUF4167 domain-containing protein [Sphingomicrobium sp.]
MINNRQGGRRRGRGGQRQSGSSGQSGNRQDNRQRGNAAQLLEKYKSMARDSQLSGDRVQTEYYLQFADHYFRMLNESKSRTDDQRRQRGDDMDDDDGDDSDLDMMDGDGDYDGDDGDDRAAPQPAPQAERAPRRDRPRREPRADDRSDTRSDTRTDNRDDNREDNRTESRPSRVVAQRGNGDAMPFDALPPAIGAEPAENRIIDDEGGEEVRRPRRRTRAVRPADGEDEAAPAA